jgi:hypothetical protein
VGSRRFFPRREAGRSHARRRRMLCLPTECELASEAAVRRRLPDHGLCPGSERRRVDSPRRQPTRGFWCSTRRGWARSLGSCRLFLGAGAVLVSAHGGAVNHSVFIVRIGCQYLEYPLPHAARCPARKSCMNLDRVPEAFRQVSPRNPCPVAVNHRLHK